MRICRISSNSISKVPIALALGNFDGVHLGHQALIQTMLDAAKSHHLMPTVGFFYPHPHLYFNRPHQVITPWRLKIHLLSEMGVKQVMMFRFDAKMAAMSPHDFVSLLQKNCATRRLFVGQDFRFGAKRQGDVAFLSKHMASVSVLEDVQWQEARISSSLCREDLREGNISALEAKLGRSYAWLGRRQGGVYVPIDPHMAMPKMGRYQVLCADRILHIEVGERHIQCPSDLQSPRILLDHFQRLSS